MKLIVIWLNILDISIVKAIKYLVKKLHSGKPQIISEAKYLSSSYKVVYGKCELGSHADTTISVESLCILQYTIK